MSELASREIRPPRTKIEPLSGAALQELHQALGGDWQVIEGTRLEKQFEFSDFQQALEFTNRVGELAEQVDHHPEICLSWGRARITIWTHSIGGLSEADFVFAARCDRLAGG